MTLQSGLCMETLLHKRYHQSKQNQMIQKKIHNSIQLNKPKRLNTINTS